MRLVSVDVAPKRKSGNRLAVSAFRSLEFQARTSLACRNYTLVVRVLAMLENALFKPVAR